MTFETLSVAQVSRRCPLLVTAAGRPVWPVTSPQELAALEETARRVGASVDVVDSANVHAGPTAALGGTVVCDEPTLRAQARLYAHLTQRRLVDTADLSDLSDIDDLEIFICSSTKITEGLLDRLYDPERAKHPGIIYGRTSEELHAQILRASASAYLKTAAPGLHVRLWPERGAGSPEEHRAVLEAIGLDASVMVLMSHSDGLDAALAKGLIACPIRSNVRAPEHRTPECGHSGWCHRLKLPVTEAFNLQRLVKPDALRARVLVWSACYGVLDDGAPLARQWSLVHRFALNPRLNVILAKWRCSWGHGPLHELVERLGAGVSVGEAVRAFNASPGVVERCSQLAIIGDPNVTSPLSEHYPRLDPFYSAQASSLTDAGPCYVYERCAPGPLSQEDESRLELLEQSIRGPVSRSNPADPLGIAGSDFAACAAAFRADPSPVQKVALQKAALRCYRHLPDVIPEWAPLARTQRCSVAGPCGQCGISTSQALHELKTNNGSRRVRACVRCQIIEDSPVGLDLDFRILPDRSLELLGVAPAAHFVGAGVIWSTNPVDGSAFEWPCGPDQLPVRRLQVDARWPRGVARVAVWMMFDLQYVMLKHRTVGCSPHMTAPLPLLEDGAERS
jgi:hypothetical protein